MSCVEQIDIDRVVVSVVLATYCGEKYVQQQLDSLANQTLLPDEVIIVDDASTDTTINIVRKFIETHNVTGWRVYESSENRGYRHNFLRGVSKASGEFVFLCDQDDIWDPRKIEVMTNILSENINILSLNCSVQLIDSNGLVLNKRTGFPASDSNISASASLEEIHLSDVMVQNIGPGAAVAMRRELVSLFVQNYEYELPHDWYLNMLAARRRGCYHISQPLVKYRIHEQNAIGARTHWRRALQTKGRLYRIEDYQGRLAVFSKVLNCDNEVVLHSVWRSWEYTRRRADFYRKPTVKSWARLVTRGRYWSASNLKTVVWDALLAVGVVR